MISVDAFIRFTNQYQARLQSSMALLNLLDNRIGDGDHGTNMVRGFRAGAGKLNEVPAHDLGAACTTLAMTLLGTVGGASGPLFGTAFLKFGTVWRGLDQIDNGLFLQGLEAALEGIQARGKAVPGDKTMVDVWDEVVSFLREAEDRTNDVFIQAAGVAQQAALNTKERVAKKGRAAYLGSRSIGVCDPGSVSSALLFEELMDVATRGVRRLEWETLALY